MANSRAYLSEYDYGEFENAKRMYVQTPEERVDWYRGRFSPSDSSQSDRGDHGSEGEQEPASPTRMHVQTPGKRVDRYRGRSSPSDSSQSDRRDHGSEGEQEHASPTTYKFAEPKKKRTRTLTTPHQAAVLHALLAQVCPVAHKHDPVTEVGPKKSRFPTTAMREAVGKQIGLSARKVQVSALFPH